MSDPVLITDHVRRAKSHLTSDFRRPTIEALTAAFVESVQELEVVFYQLIVARFVDSAVGAALDQLGALVGERRDGLNDVDYRRFVRARITSNGAEAEIPRLLSVLRTITGAFSVHYMPEYPAGYRVAYVVPEFLSAGIRARIAETVERMTTSGVGFDIVEAESGYFGFADDPDALGFDEGVFAEEIL